MKSSENYENIANTLSHSRLATYKKFAKDQHHALLLYRWNLQISSALLECLAMCEISMRNAVATAIQSTYGDKWAWNTAFLTSLQKNAKEPLVKINEKFDAIDKIIPELPFYFWQSIFTARFDSKIWQHALVATLPNADHSDLKHLRETVFNDLEKIRKLRNRIAHHEPVFNRNLSDDYKRIVKIIEYRCQDTAKWVHSWQKVTLLLQERP